MTVQIDVLTLFPNMFNGPFEDSIIQRARSAGLLALNLIDLRNFTTDRHRTADDAPYGGGAGMLLRPQPIVDAIASIELAAAPVRPTILLTAAQGRRLNHPLAEELSRRTHLVIVCGHYEGIDARVRELTGAIEVSIGDYILTGGEIAALVIVDAVARLIPGVLGAEESLAEESMTGGLLEYSHYTRPADFRGSEVPSVLLSGDHDAIRQWRRNDSLTRTFRERPDLLAEATFVAGDAAILSRLVALPSTPNPPLPGHAVDVSEGRVSATD